MAPAKAGGMSKGVLGAIVAVVVVVIIIVALLLTGIIPGLSTSSSGGTKPSGPSYNITFSETGLTAGTSWSVGIGGSNFGSTTSTVVVKEPNGSYTWSASASGYKSTPPTGPVVVAGAATSASVTFTKLAPGLYSVTFTESGLPASTNWAVTFNGTAGNSGTTTIVFTIGNGSWTYSVGAVTGYTATPSSGAVTVSGAATSQPITFTSNGGGGGGAQTYSQAKPVADSTVGPHSSSAVLVFAIGIDSRSSFTNSTQNASNVTCPLTGGSVTSLTAPSFTGNYAAGLSPAWIFLYYQASPVAEFAVVVINGAGTYIGEVTGSSCVGSGLANDTVPSNAIDSSAAGAAAAGTSNGSAFVTAHSSADADYVLFGSNNSLYGDSWLVTFTTCQAGVTGAGSEYFAAVNATTSVVPFSFGPLSINCTGSPVLVASGGPHLVPLSSESPSLAQHWIAATSPRE